MKSLSLLGWRKLLRYAFLAPVMAAFPAVCYSPVRITLLRILGAAIGAGSTIHPVKFFNWYHDGFRHLQMGRDCFIGDDCLLDLAAPIRLANQVTLAERVTILTHTNIGYPDHPLQAAFPPFKRGVSVERGAFLGACSTILPGVTIGEESMVAAGAVVTKDVTPRTIVAGVPARYLRSIDLPSPSPKA